MGRSKFCTAILLVSIALSANEAVAQSVASDADALIRQGERLAQQKRYNDALVAFKSADLLHPRAEHDCWIGLAYARLKLATQANYFISKCQERAGKRRPIPWYPKAKRLAEQMLSRDEYAPVTIEVLHGGGKVRPEMFEPDEWLASPVKLWLPVGRHQLESKAPGFGIKRTAIEVLDDSPKKVRIDLTGSKSGASTSPVRFPSLVKSKPKPKAKPQTAQKKKDEAPPPVPKTMPQLAAKKEKLAEAPKVEDAPPKIKAAPTENTSSSEEAPPAVDMNASASSNQPESSGDESGSLLPILSWTSLGLGAAILGSSAYFYGLGDEAARRADETLDKDVRSAEVANYQNYATLTYVAYGVGGGLMATGLGLLIVDWVSGPETPQASIAIIPQSSGGYLSLSGQF